MSEIENEAQEIERLRSENTELMEAMLVYTGLAGLFGIVTAGQTMQREANDPVVV
jgi:hypothetical protein